MPQKLNFIHPELAFGQLGIQEELPNVDDKRQPWPNADKKSGPQLLTGPKLLSFGPTLFKYYIRILFWALYFGPSRIGFSLGHVLGLRRNWALEVILDQKGELGQMGQE